MKVVDENCNDSKWDFGEANSENECLNEKCPTGMEVDGDDEDKEGILGLETANHRLKRKSALDYDYPLVGKASQSVRMDMDSDEDDDENVPDESKKRSEEKVTKTIDTLPDNRNINVTPAIYFVPDSDKTLEISIDWILAENAIAVSLV